MTVREHLRAIADEVRAWPSYMRVTSSASSKRAMPEFQEPVSGPRDFEPWEDSAIAASLLYPDAYAEAVAAEDWKLEAAAAKAETAAVRQRETQLREALGQAIAEIASSPYETEAWGWGIAYRIDKWRAVLADTSPPTLTEPECA